MSQSTISSSLSDRKLAANRANARRSTGPRTARGKAIAAANSLRHGLFAKELLLPGEDAAALTQLKTSMLRRLNPRDVVELQIVDRIVSASWKLQRLQRYERLLHERECQEREEDVEFDRETVGLGHREPITADIAWLDRSDAFDAELQRLATAEHKLENSIHRNLKQLATLQKQEPVGTVCDFTAEAIAHETQASETREFEAAAKAELTLGGRAEKKREHHAALIQARIEAAEAEREMNEFLDEAEGEDEAEEDEDDAFVSAFLGSK